MKHTRPEWLKPYAFVTGHVQSAPLDLAQRMETVYRRLQAESWSVVVKSIGTDFSGPLGIPAPKSQPIELYLFRKESFSASEAQAALSGALRATNLSYSPTGAWLGEIVDQVVLPTAVDLRTAHRETATNAAWLIVGGLAACVLIARATAPAADAYARLYENLRRPR